MSMENDNNVNENSVEDIVSVVAITAVQAQKS